MDKLIKIAVSIFVIIVIACLAVFFSGALNHLQTPPAGTNTIYFFYGEECPHCHKVMPLVINLTQKYPGANIQILEVWHNQTNKKIFNEANTYAGITEKGVPEVILGRTVLLGDQEILDKLEGLVQDYLKKKP
jgi:thiol-disulfide isomerase/thioredoxin